MYLLLMLSSYYTGALKVAMSHNAALTGAYLLGCIASSNQYVLVVGVVWNNWLISNAKRRLFNPVYRKKKDKNAGVIVFLLGMLLLVGKYVL